MKDSERVILMHNPNQSKEELKAPNADKNLLNEEDEAQKSLPPEVAEKDERKIPMPNKVEISYPPEMPGEYKKVPNRR
jgi:hypothetical protein